LKSLFEFQSVVFADNTNVDFLCVTGTTADTSGDTTIQLGSLLDDGQWHDVEVSRIEQDVILTVDRLNMTNITNGDFYQLDLDRRVLTVDIYWQ